MRFTSEQLLQNSINKSKAEGKAEGQVTACRSNLLVVLKSRFETLSQDIVSAIESFNDLSKFSELFASAARAQSLEAFKADLAAIGEAAR